MLSCALNSCKSGISMPSKGLSSHLQGSQCCPERSLRGLLLGDTEQAPACSMAMEMMRIGCAGETGAMGEKEIEETSATAEDDAGTVALEPVSQTEKQASDPLAAEAVKREAPGDALLSSRAVAEADSAGETRLSLHL